MGRAEKTEAQRLGETSASVGCMGMGFLVIMAVGLQRTYASPEPALSGWHMVFTGVGVVIAALVALSLACAACTAAVASARASRPDAGSEAPQQPPEAPEAPEGWPPPDEDLRRAADTDAIRALTALGFGRKQAGDAVQRVRASGRLDDDADAGAVVTAALEKGL